MWLSVLGLFKCVDHMFCYEYETHLQNYKCVLITRLVKSGVSATWYIVVNIGWSGHYNGGT